MRFLLLGCGDARNILYTVFCNQHGYHHVEIRANLSTDPLKTKELLFTCCDIESAVLGRPRVPIQLTPSSKHHPSKLDN